jgi:tetratricopeptide (TPR) repeat protein
VSLRTDKRRWVIPAMLIATGAFGLAVQHIGDGIIMETTPSHSMSADERLVHQHFQQAVGLLQAREYDYALQGFHEVLRLRPAMPEAHTNMGFALLGLQEYAAARDFFDAATEIRPSQTNAYYGLAIAHQGQGDLRNALLAMQTFVHTSQTENAYRRKAEAAIWEWGAELAEQQP